MLNSQNSPIRRAPQGINGKGADLPYYNAKLNNILNDRMIVNIFSENIHYLALPDAGTSMNTIQKRRSFGLGCYILSVSIWLWAAPLIKQLPEDYFNQTIYDARMRIRLSPEAEWQSYNLTVKRIDQTLSNAGRVNIIQGEMNWLINPNDILFVSSGIYGVDRRSHQNVTGYGDIARSGQFLFPPHTQATTYEYWDPNFIGKRIAAFKSEEMFDDLKVYLFTFSCTKIDETEGYSYLPDVPEKYETYTDGQGLLWIEPVSGIIVDYAENGVSYFAYRANGEKATNFAEWNAHYSPETRSAQIELARADRLRILLLDVWLPIFFVLVGLFWLGFGVLMLRQRNRKINGEIR